MTPLPPIIIPTGDGRVNATALDGVMKLIVDRINATISALNVALADRTQLVDRSVRARNLSAELRGAVADLAARVAAIRATLTPGVAVQPIVEPVTATPAETLGKFRFTCPTTDISQPFTLDGDPLRTYRLRFRARSCCARTLFSPSYVQVRGLARTYVGSTVVLADSGTNFAADVAPMLLDTGRVPMVLASGETRRIVGVLAGPDRIIVDQPFTTSLANAPVSVNFAVGTYMRDTYAFRTMAAVLAAGGVPQGDHIIAFPKGTMQPLGNTDFVWVETPTSDILLTAALYDPLAGIIDQQLARALDESFDVLVPGNATLMLHSESSIEQGAFYVESDYPADDDPRFPAAYRFPRAQFVQLDLTAIEHIVLPDDDAILAETGVPLDSEAPQAQLTPE